MKTKTLQPRLVRIFLDDNTNSTNINSASDTSNKLTENTANTDTISSVTATGDNTAETNITVATPEVIPEEPDVVTT